MPGAGSPIVIGGGISLGSPADVSHFLKLTSADPPAANTSNRLLEDTNSILCVGNGADATSIGPSANAAGAGTVALGSAVSTTQANSFAIGQNITLANQNQLVVGSISSAAGTYNLASSWVGIGTQLTFSTFPSNSVYIGSQASGGGNSAVGIGASVAINGNSSVAIGSNAQAGTNSVSVGPLATSGTGGASNAISIGVGTTGLAGGSGVILIGNRNGAPTGVLANGDIVLGHQDSSNNIYSVALYFGGPLHSASTVVPAFTLRGRLGNGTNINVGDTTWAPQRATGNAAGGGIAIQSTAPGASGTTAQTLTTTFRIDPSQNITLCGAAGSYGSGAGVVFIGNATTNPTTNPTGGGILYVNAGALTYRGSGGTVTVLAAA